jgi:hypothetical protein
MRGFDMFPIPESEHLRALELGFMRACLDGAL